MRRIAISVAALTAMGLLATAAQADSLAGAPPTKGGMVFKFYGAHSQDRDSRWGYWAPAPAPAAATVAPKARKRSSR